MKGGIFGIKHFKVYDTHEDILVFWTGFKSWIFIWFGRMHFIVKETAEYLADVDNYAGIFNYLDFLDLSTLSNS